VLLEQAPFRTRGFQSDKRSEFINRAVKKLLNELLIEQTKSVAGTPMTTSWRNERRSGGTLESTSFGTIRWFFLQPHG